VLHERLFPARKPRHVPGPEPRPFRGNLFSNLVVEARHLRPIEPPDDDGLGQARPSASRPAAQAGRNTARVSTASYGGEPELILWGGKIHTMDGAKDELWTVASAVEIKDGRFERVHRGKWRPRRAPRGTRVVNLKGRTVIPGLVETHTHVLLMGLRPGWHTPLENAFSIADVQEIFAARREGRNPHGWWADSEPVPKGEWITSIGGFSTNTFAEQRMPTLQELDAAVADRPVFLFNQLLGPCATNTLGKEYFEANGVLVGEDGSIRTGPESN
jgi:Amidohydrolase family